MKSFGLTSYHGPAIAIFDPDAPPGLAFTRSLGRIGVHIRVYSHKTWPVARLSRYCSDFRHCPPLEDAETFLPWLKQETASGRIDWVAPTSDLMAFYMAEFPECFPAQQRQATPSRTAVLNMLLKDRFDTCCKAHGIPVPATAAPLSLEQAYEQAKQLRFPLILKPKSHVGVGWARGKVVHSFEELRAHFSPYTIPKDRHIVAERFPELVWPMLQEYIPDALSHLYSISGVLDGQGGVFAAAGSQKTLQWPPKLGVGIVFEHWDQPAVIEKGLRFVQQVLERGIFELEFILDPRDGQHVAIDLNPRAHGHISFDIARGHDLPLLWYQLTTGERPAKPGPIQQEVRWTHAIPYHLGQWIGIVKGPKRWQKCSDYVQSVRQPSVDIIHDSQDPLPSFAHTAFMLRHPGSLIKPFWREL